MENPVDLDALHTALDDLIADEFGVPLGPDDITITSFQQQVIKRVGRCTWDTARKKIKELEAAGKLEYLGERRAKSGKLLDAWRVRHGG